MIWKALMLLCIVLTPFAAETTNETHKAGVPSRYDYQSFKLIPERNIFNPNRSARSTRNDKEREKPKKAESFALRGTMSYEKGTFAFFEGSSSEFRKALSPNQTIAGYTITAIEPNGVKLEHGSNKVELAVGQQMRREDEGEWTVSQADRSIASSAGGKSSSSSSETNSGTNDSSATSGKDDENPILKKLRLKREQELKK
jgi:hypothetical protein